MIDGIELCERCHGVALGLTIDRTKVQLGLWEGSTENATTVTAFPGRSRADDPRRREGAQNLERKSPAVLPPVGEGESAELHGARETKCTPSRPSSEKPSAAPDETSIRKRGVPQRSYWSESI